MRVAERAAERAGALCVVDRDGPRVAKLSGAVVGVLANMQRLKGN